MRTKGQPKGRIDTHRVAPNSTGATMTQLRQIEKYLTETGMPWTKFGRIVAHDPRLVADLRNGRAPRAALAKKIETYLKSEMENPHAL
jgi:hypothetical protein